MILNVLVKRYEDTQKVAIGWKEEEVSFALNISKTGELLEIMSLEEEVSDKNGKKRTIKKKLSVPMDSGRSGTKAYETAYFLCDTGEYFLGRNDPTKKDKKGKEKFQSAADFHLTMLGNNKDDDMAVAITAYFSNGCPQTLPQDIDEIKLARSKFIFFINGRFADNQNESLKRAWDEHYSKENTITKGTTCLVTGKPEKIASTHPKIKFPGAQNLPVLVSANKSSFTSYGKTKKDTAANIGSYAAFAYVSAINEMLKNPLHNQSIGDDRLIYWAESQTETEAEIFKMCLSPKEEDAEGKLDEIVNKMASGEWIAPENCVLEARFYLLCLSLNKARVGVRYFHCDTFGKILHNIQQHYKRLEVIGQKNYEKHPAIRKILNETVVKSAKEAKPNPLLGGQLLKAIVTNSPLPIALYQAILRRIKNEQTANGVRVGVIKAYLLQQLYEKEKEVITVALNKETNNQSYVLGRLFSILEQLQEKALNKDPGKAPMRERFFTAACTNPSNAFPSLLRLSLHHAAKLTDQEKIWFEKSKTELIGKLEIEQPFPARLDMKEQGLFILGYYHQTQDR